MNIYEYLDQLQFDLLKSPTKDIELKYSFLCSKLAGKEIIKKFKR